VIILGIVLLLVGYLLFKHPLIVGAGWLLLVVGVVLLLLHGVVHVTTY